MVLCGFYGFRFVNGRLVASRNDHWGMGSMHIICPHCTTSYGINLATLGAAGRTVRCFRCKEVWLARPEDAVKKMAQVPAMAAAGQSASQQATSQQDAADEWEA